MHTYEAAIESTKTNKNFWIYLNLNITLNIKYGIIISSTRTIYTYNGENKTDSVLVAEGKLVLAWSLVSHKFW